MGRKGGDEEVQKVFQICTTNRNVQPVLQALKQGIVTPETVYQQFTLLHIASANGRTLVVTELIKRGCDVNKSGSNLRLTALHMAASKGTPQIVDELIQAGADVSVADVNNCTPLHCAISNNRIQAVEILIKAGANLFVEDKSNLTPVKIAGLSKNCAAFIQMAVQQNLYRFATCVFTHYRNYIRESGVEETLTKTIDTDGNSLLMLVVRTILKQDDSDSLVVEIWSSFLEELLALGASVYVVNKSNQTVFSMIQHKNYMQYPLQRALYNVVFNEKTRRVDLRRLCLHQFSTNLLKCISETSPRVIDLRYNYLDSLPEELGQLPFIENVKLEGNTLRFLPKEYHNLSQWQKLQKYLVSIQNRAERWKERKLLFVGEEEAGKSTLIKCFLTKRNKTTCKENLATDGIQVYHDISLVSGQISNPSLTSDLLISAWDLGGQQIFYPTHHFFLSSHSTYIVVFNLVKPNFARIEYWLRTLKLLSTSNENTELPPSRVYLVGTHADNELCTEEYLANITETLHQKYRKNIYRNLQGIYIVSSKTGLGISTLKEKLLDSFSNENIKVPPTWVRFADSIKERQEMLSWTNWIAYRKWAKDVAIPEEDLLRVTRFLCDFGCLVFHESKTKLERSLIVLNPQWLSDVMTCIISVKTSNWIRGGILEGKKIPNIFDRFPTNIHSTLTELLENFNIIYPSRKSNDYIVPSLLDETVDSSKLSIHWEPILRREFCEIGRIIKFPFLPIGFFERFITHMLHLDSIKVNLMWRHGMKLALKQTKNMKPCIALVTFNENTYELHVRVRYLKNTSNIQEVEDGAVLTSPGLLLRTILEVADTFTGGYNMEFDTQRFVVCSHCIAKHSPKPFLFSFVEVIEAVKEKKAFIFCENICSPSRCVNVSEIAPDIAMIDMQEIDSNDIEVDKEIGRGGFGTVFSGVLTCSDKTKTPVAIKEITLKGETSHAIEEFFLEFQGEAFVMSKLNHPNLVKFYGITTDPLRMILELVTGGDLLHFLHPERIPTKRGTTSGGQVSREKFPWKLRLLIALDVAKGMQYLQQINPPVIHRDLRSPNIFLSSFSEDPNDVRAKIADFGLSRSSAVGLHGALGTWQWLAPEVLEGKSSYNELSDNYSYGICCWEIATRLYPFDEFEGHSEFIDPLTNCIAAHLIKPHIIDKDLRPSMPPPEEGAPPEFIEIIRGCLRKDPNQRPSFDEIVSKLRRLLHLPEEGKDSFAVHYRIFKAKAQAASTNKIRIRSPTADPKKDLTFSTLFLPGSEFLERSVESRISTLLCSKDVVTLGLSDGTVNQYTLQGKLKNQWKQLHSAAISSILFIPSERCYWSADLLGNIFTWRSPRISFGETNTSQQLPRFSTSSEKFSAINMRLVEAETGTKTIWVYTLPNTEHTIWLYNSSGVLTYHLAFPHPLVDLIPFQSSIWIAADTKIYLYDSISLHFKVDWKAHEMDLMCLCAAGPCVWSGDCGGTINIWEAQGEEIRLQKTLTLHTGNCIRAIHFIPPNYVISMAKDIVIVWNTTTFVPLQEITINTSVSSISSFLGGFLSVDNYCVWKYSKNNPSGFRRAHVPGKDGHSSEDAKHIGIQRANTTNFIEVPNSNRNAGTTNISQSWRGPRSRPVSINSALTSKSLNQLPEIPKQIHNETEEIVKQPSAVRHTKSASCRGPRPVGTSSRPPGNATRNGPVNTMRRKAPERNIVPQSEPRLGKNLSMSSPNSPAGQRQVQRVRVTRSGNSRATPTKNAENLWTSSRPESKTSPAPVIGHRTSREIPKKERSNSLNG